MNTYEVTVKLECTYTIDAPTSEIAEEIALDWFDECEPEIYSKEVSE